MPVLLKGDSNMAIRPMTYSPSAVARRFEVLEEVSIADTNYQVIFDAETPFAAVIEAAPSIVNDVPRHKVVATLELQRRARLEGVLVKNFWEDREVAQIEGVVVDGAMRDVGLATFVYETVAIKTDTVLLSDNEQYAGGKALWQHIARESKDLVVYILDTDTAQYFPFDGERIRYDSECIPEAEIWSEHPDTSKHAVVLVAEPAKKLERAIAS